MFKFPTLTPGSHCSGLCFYIFFPDCHINGIFYITFWDRVLSVTVTNLNCIPVVACINSSFLSCSVAAAAAKSLQSCPTLCNPIDGSPSGSSVPGILQARTLEWIAISFSNAWKWKVKVKSESEVAQSCRTLSDPMDCSLPGSSVHGIFQARVLEWGAITPQFVYPFTYRPAFEWFPFFYELYCYKHICICIQIYKHKFLLLWDKALEMELLSHIWSIYVYFV